MPSLVEQKMCEAGWVAVRVICRVSDQKRAYIHALIHRHSLPCKDYKNAKYPEWAAMRKVLPQADILGLPENAADLWPLYAEVDGDSDDDGEAPATSEGLPPLISPRRQVRVKRSKSRARA